MQRIFISLFIVPYWNMLTLYLSAAEACIEKPGNVRNKNLKNNHKDKTSK